MAGNFAGGGAQVALLAALSRVVWLAWAFAVHSVCPAYDTSTAAAAAAYAGPETGSLARAMGSWDGVHFQAIAAHGYRREHALAFFPGYPLLQSWAHALLTPLGSPSLAASALILQQCMFPLAAALLWQLGQARGLSPRAADAAALLLCASPATPFLVASYSELLFLLLVCAAELATARCAGGKAGWGRSFLALFAATCWLGAASARSNGSLLVLARLVALSVIQFNGHIPSLAAAVAAAAVTALAPASLHAWRMRDQFCNGPDAPLWCHSWSPTAPYGHVQRTYWGLSFGGYYTIAQAPNFALALPCVIASVAVLAPRLALAARRARPLARARGLCGVWRAIAAWSAVEEGSPALPLSHALYWTALIMVAVSVAHVQIVTRLVASAPAFYFALGTAVTQPGAKRPYRTALAAWCLGYSGVGIALFVCFLPWT